MRLNLLVARKKARLSQRQVAEQSGISVDKYSNIENGRQLIVDVELANIIAKIVKDRGDNLFLQDNSYKIRTKSKGA